MTSTWIGLNQLVKNSFPVVALLRLSPFTWGLLSHSSAKISERQHHVVNPLRRQARNFGRRQGGGHSSL